VDVDERASSSDHVALILFDLGGVLVELGAIADLLSLTGITTEQEFWRRWATSPWVRQFERGTCSAEQFADGIVTEWGIPIEPEEFLRTFSLWSASLLAGAEELVDELKESRPVGCLSNTNRLHWDRQLIDWPLLDRFDYRFLSFELGVVKPERAAFEAVARELPVSAERTLFLDDNPANVDGARAAGFLAEQVQGVAGARRALSDHGVIERDRQEAGDRWS
jgi:glucose-1-phosphatase